MIRLLQGRPEVLALLGHDPFAGRPPKLIRAEVYEYSFTDWQTRRTTGKVWSREQVGTYLPPVNLESLSRLPLLNDK